MRSFHGRRGLIGGALTLAVAVSMVAMLAAGPVSSATGAANKPHVTKVAGGTAYFAEPPGGSPNFIFPFAPFRYFSVDNLSQFQMLMYRPLYWFGNGANPTINLALSLADYPTFTNGGKTVTVTLKNYVWSDGEKLTAQDVVFWMSFMKLEKDTWAGYVPGTIPDDVASITTPNSTTVVFNLTGSVNPYWWVYNELSQITPLPMAWDMTALQPEGRLAVVRHGVVPVCRREVDEDRDRSRQRHREELRQRLQLPLERGRLRPRQPQGLEQRLRDLRDNPIWQVVDGPWHLTSFRHFGHFRRSSRTRRTRARSSRRCRRSSSCPSRRRRRSSTRWRRDVDHRRLHPGGGPHRSRRRVRRQVGPNNPRASGKYNLVPWILVGYQLLPVELQLRRRRWLRGHDLPPALLPSGAADADQPAPDHQEDRQGLRRAGLRAGPGSPEELVRDPVRGDEPVPVQPDEGHRSSDGPRLDDQAGRDGHLRRRVEVRRARGDRRSTSRCCTRAATSRPTETVDDEVSSWSPVGIHVTATAETFDTVYGTSIPCSGSSCTWSMRLVGRLGLLAGLLAER